MSDRDDALPEADRLDDAPHPRETARLIGQDAAEAAFIDALNTGRLPHGWLLTGPMGIGKATLAWRVARHLIATPVETGDALFAPPPVSTLDIADDHPVARRMLAMSEPNLMLLRRPWDSEKKRLKADLTVDEVRRLKGFFQMRAEAGSRRVVIVDSADDMNANAANALLKELEEPPANTTLLLISHRPSGLLPTIRSRCRVLRLAPLGTPDLIAALAAAGHTVAEADAEMLAGLAEGSVGAAVQLMAMDGLTLYREIAGLMAAMPGMDRATALKLSETAAAKGAEARFDMTLHLVDVALSRLARAGVVGPSAADPAGWARLAPHAGAARAWADLAATLTAKARRGKAVNLDPAALIFDMFLDLERTAAQVLR